MPLICPKSRYWLNNAPPTSKELSYLFIWSNIVCDAYIISIALYLWALKQVPYKQLEKQMLMVKKIVLLILIFKLLCYKSSTNVNKIFLKNKISRRYRRLYFKKQRPANGIAEEILKKKYSWIVIFKLLQSPFYHFGIF